MWKKGIRVIVSFVVVLLVWQIACTVTNANATLFPSPVKVGEEFVKLFTQGLDTKRPETGSTKQRQKHLQKLILDRMKRRWKFPCSGFIMTICRSQNPITNS